MEPSLPAGLATPQFLISTHMQQHLCCRHVQVCSITRHPERESCEAPCAVQLQIADDRNGVGGCATATMHAFWEAAVNFTFAPSRSLLAVIWTLSSSWMCLHKKHVVIRQYVVLCFGETGKNYFMLLFISGFHLFICYSPSLLVAFSLLASLAACVYKMIRSYPLKASWLGVWASTGSLVWLPF